MSNINRLGGIHKKAFKIRTIGDIIDALPTVNFRRDDEGWHADMIPGKVPIADLPDSLSDMRIGIGFGDNADSLEITHADQRERDARAAQRQLDAAVGERQRTIDALGSYARNLEQRISDRIASANRWKLFGGLGLGASIGALIGNSIASRRKKTLATLVGLGLGGVLGGVGGYMAGEYPTQRATTFTQTKYQA